MIYLRMRFSNLARSNFIFLTASVCMKQVVLFQNHVATPTHIPESTIFLGTKNIYILSAKKVCMLKVDLRHILFVLLHRVFKKLVTCYSLFTLRRQRKYEWKVIDVVA